MLLILCLGMHGLFAEDTHAADLMTNYCQLPTFVSNALPPNVLIIMDNSNSMDEDVYGNAIGSFDQNSKSAMGKIALQQLVNTYAAKMNIGIATYSLPSASKYELHNSPYFVSYQPKSYCPSPPADCVNYCQTGDATAKTNCQTACVAQNPAFDATYLDQIITDNAIGSARRNNYCSLVYPKTLETINATDTSNYIYYKQSLPFYDSSNQGNGFCYSNAYNSNPYPNNGTYNCWSAKTTTSDAYINYGGINTYNGGFQPTDSDYANGYDNFGKRMAWWHIGPTWFANGSPGGGYLKVPIATSTTAQINSLLAALATTATSPPNYGACANVLIAGDQTPCNFYMSCNNTGNPNACTYIVNAGLTPTAGTFQTAINYFKGTLNQGGAIPSPILDRCRKNYIVYVTDGMPDTNESGNAGSTAALMPTVLTKLGLLRCPTLNVSDGSCKFTLTISGTTYPFDIKTYVLGVGLSATDKTYLDQMAAAGGTDQENLNNPGHAFYIDSQADFINAMTDVFVAITRNVESGTAASVLSSGEGSGSNLLQASFYPRRLFGGTEIAWTGGLQNLWYFLDPGFAKSNIREDTVHDDKLQLKQDYIMQFYYDTVNQLTMAARYQDANGDGSSLVSQNTPTIGFDQIQNIWDSGTLLWQRNIATAPRTIYTTIDGSSLIPFSIANTATIMPYLNTASTTTAQNVINYELGTDLTPTSTYRSRTVTIGAATNVWKLGDILNSTPKISTWVPLNSQYWTLYGDSTYNDFTNTTSYAGRGAVFVGSNDGMFHAFKLGTLQLQWSGEGQFEKARLLNPDTGTVCSPTDANPCGKELWSFIPKNVLPYLKYNYDPNYCHVYSVDLAPFLFDASIQKPASCTKPNYWDCLKDSTSWRTVVIGGMRLGGACRDVVSADVAGDGLPGDVQTPAAGMGYSSYFALDVTDQNNPILLWEFSNSQLGFASTGPAIVRISAINSTTGLADSTLNGRWLVVVGSGPTGPINTSSNQFMGRSDQNLRFFVLDLPTGNLLKTIDTGIPYAFAGSMYNSTHDAGWTNPQLKYQDSVIYVPYTYRSATTTNSVFTWTNGGVGRIVTNLNLDPTTWTWSKVIDGLGPITASVQHLDDPDNSNMWLFFGEGRYFYAQNSGVDDANSVGSATGQRRIYGIKEPCATLVQASPNNYFKIDPNKAGTCQTGVTVGSLTDVTTSFPADCSTTNQQLPTFPGWFINLDVSGMYTYAGQTFNFGAERDLTDPVASTNGLVFYTTFKPYINECTVGGQTKVWAVNYCNGGSGGTLLQGQVLAEVSTGAIAQINLKTDMTGNLGRSTVISTPGAPPTGQGLAVFLTPPPVKRVLQIRER